MSAEPYLGEVLWNDDITGDVLKEIRKKMGLTQQKLADQLGVGVKTVNRYETTGAIPKQKKRLMRMLFAPTGHSLVEQVKLEKDARARAIMARGPFRTPRQLKLQHSYRGWKVSDRPRLGGWCPGDYAVPCSTCKKTFGGDKRAFTCADCAYHDIDLLAADILRSERAQEACLKVHYPDSKIGLRRTGGPLLDFINLFLKSNPEYNGHFWGEDGTGSGAHWQITRKHKE